MILVTRIKWVFNKNGLKRGLVSGFVLLVGLRLTESSWLSAWVLSDVIIDPFVVYSDSWCYHVASRPCGRMDYQPTPPRGCFGFGLSSRS